MATKRSWVLVDAKHKDILNKNGQPKHVYTGSTPSGAAKKAINAKGKSKAGQVVEVRLRERGENQHKILVYKGKCVKVDAPEFMQDFLGSKKKVCKAEITSKKVVTR
jgi:hypothetical protein